MKIAFIGYRGTGKTTIARLLSKKLALNFVDSDRQIEQRMGMSIQQIFAEHGEEFFRKVEAEVLESILLKQEEVLLSTGGGAILSQKNRELLKNHTTVIWLRAAEETIFQRIFKDKGSLDNRPALTKMSPREEISFILQQRTPLYQECADITIDTDEVEPEDIVQLLLMDPVLVSRMQSND